MPKSGTSKPFLGGALGPSKEKAHDPLGPGRYEVVDRTTVQSFVIVKPKRAHTTDKGTRGGHVGPQKYDPVKPGETYKGQKFPGQSMDQAFNPESFGPFGNGRRDGKGAVFEDDNLRKKRETREKSQQYFGVPGPGNYKLTGDFDFRDQTRPDDHTGKVPKFCFGMKTSTRQKNIDVPGPGSYEVDVYPMNQANIAYWIGTDVRRDLAVPYSHMYPGPGGGLEEYYPHDPM